MFCGLALLLASATAAQQRHAVSVELVLAIDVSASVDGSEFALQAGGIAAAFRRPDVVALIERHPGGIAVAVMQWSGWPVRPDARGWYLVTGPASAAHFADAVAAMPRASPGTRTAIGAALAGGAEAIAANRFDGLRLVIDLSGDGRSNAGPEPAAGRGAARAQGITVNGLAVLTDDGGLDSYYRRQVIGGPGAFTAAIESYRDFPDAIAAKLLRELALPPRIGALGPSLR